MSDVDTSQNSNMGIDAGDIYRQNLAAHNCACLFCGEKDFDFIGLKIHLERGYCEVYNAIPPYENRRNTK